MLLLYPERAERSTTLRNGEVGGVCCGFLYGDRLSKRVLVWGVVAVMVGDIVGISLSGGWEVCLT